MASWAGWSRVPGGLTFDAPAVAGRGDHLELIVRGTDDFVHRNVFDGGAWAGWTAVPGDTRTPSAPAAVVLSSGLSVFVRLADGSMRHNLHPGGTIPWHGWEQVPVGLTPSAPTVTLYHPNGPFILRLVVRGTNDGIHFNTLSGGWAGWAEVPGGGRTRSAPAAAHVDGSFLQRDEMHVCVRGTDDALHVNRFDGSDWSGWSAVPGGGRTFDAPAAIQFDGDLYLFVRGTDDGLHFNRFDGEWSGWSEVPGGGRTLSAPSVTVFDGDLYLFVRGTDDGVHFNRLS